MISPFKKIFFCLIIMANAQAIAATTYYVDANNSAASDTNPGTQALPWKTIGKASSKMSAGDTTIINAGLYPETLSTSFNGSAGNRITFKTSGTAIVNSISVLHDYITINGFKLASGGEITISSRSGTNGSYCEILNNDITGGSISMAYKSNPTSCLVKSNHLHGTVSPDGDAPQIQIWGTNHIVETNEIGPNSDIDAFRFWGSGHIIRNNYIHDTTYSPGSLAHSDGFQTFGDNGDVAHDIVIENNRFINSEGQLFNTSQDGVAGIHDLIVRNNLWVNYKQNANVGLPNFYFYNNTLYNTGIIYQVTGGPGQPFNGSNLVVKNNILIGLAGCDNTDFDNVYNNPSNLPLTRSNNFYSSCTGSAMVRYPNEPGGINGGNINFKNPATFDFSLVAPSPAIDAGITLSGFNYDIVGGVRPQGLAWDIGAYEFSVNSANPTLQAPQNLRVMFQ